jgi:hypothetical protein
MSTFEALKLTYCRSTGKEEPGVLALLAFGSISGSVGAASVYPLNLVRTRYQASGSPGHPQRYNGIMDVAVKTWEAGGWKGFYRGLFPTLAKVSYTFWWIRCVLVCTVLTGRMTVLIAIDIRLTSTAWCFVILVSAVFRSSQPFRFRMSCTSTRSAGMSVCCYVSFDNQGAER